MKHILTVLLLCLPAILFSQENSFFYCPPQQITGYNIYGDTLTLDFEYYECGWKTENGVMSWHKERRIKRVYYVAKKIKELKGVIIPAKTTHIQEQVFFKED